MMLTACCYISSKEGKLREYAAAAREKVTGAPGSLTYKLFRADAAAWLCNYEEAVGRIPRTQPALSEHAGVR